jgi:ketosteroid isomerase-like protein
MSRENVEIVREVYAGWSEGDFRRGLEFFDQGLQFVVDGAVTPAPGEWVGVEGMREAWRELLSAFDWYRTGPIEHVLESGDQVAAFNRLHGLGKSSGVDAGSPLRAAVFTFREGKVVRLLLTDLRGALEAAGLSE